MEFHKENQSLTNNNNKNSHSQFRTKRITSHNNRQIVKSKKNKSIPRKGNSQKKDISFSYKNNENLRCDAYGTPIKKGSHFHKVTFIDQLYKRNFAEIDDYVENIDELGNQKSNNIKKELKRKNSFTKVYNIKTIKKEKYNNFNNSNFVFNTQKGNEIDDKQETKCKACIII